jgi:cytochrome c556
MPKEMQEIGTGMHKAASKFALSIEEAGASGDIKPALGDLAVLMQQCVSCHSAYRVH